MFGKNFPKFSHDTQENSGLVEYDLMLNCLVCTVKYSFISICYSVVQKDVSIFDKVCCIERNTLQFFS